MSKELYGEYEIRFDGFVWLFHHDSYDGPGDPRCGYAQTLEEAKECIDEIEDELALGPSPSPSADS